MTEEKSKTSITNHLRTRMSDGNLDIDDLFDAHEKLELAANKLCSRLLIWIEEANTENSYLKDFEALAEFELLKNRE